MSLNANTLKSMDRAVTRLAMAVGMIIVWQAARQRYAFPVTTRRASWLRRSYSTLVARTALAAIAASLP